MTVPRGTEVESYEVVVVGAGHAGCEAALACARLGLSTALITIRCDGVAQMSCNPAIGGLGKSQIVREVDALGGEMGRAADGAAIQYRRLNSSKGPAVRARRVQCDMHLYQRRMLETLNGCKNLQLIEGVVASLTTGTDGINGVEIEDGRRVRANAVVVTTGTFLNGLMHTGEESFEGGRLGDRSSKGLAASLSGLGLQIGRLKTGTPARLLSKTANLGVLGQQFSEGIQQPFSHEGGGFRLSQVACHITRTNPRTHEIIRGALSRSPLFSGVIRGRGPRYCPSIEDKVVRFSERTGHQVILEPTDLSCEVLYPNGISTSLPKDVQEQFIRSIEGLEKVEILHFGYAVEYDFVQPTQLKSTLEVRKVPGLFLAGQINGTSGYEEAAAQGLIAGINAVAFVRRRPAVIFGRQEAYIGVMVDDLVTRGTNEPYRMFSSRAEFRLLLREDNAASRLNDWAERIGLVPHEMLAKRREKQQELRNVLSEIGRTFLPGDNDRNRVSLEKLLRRPGVYMKDLSGYLSRQYPLDVIEQAEAEVKYHGYIQREIKEAEQLRRMEERKIPADLDYGKIPGLSKELAEKLHRARPDSFGQASRLDGMTPAALMVLSVWLSKLTRVPRGTKVRWERNG